MDNTIKVGLIIRGKDILLIRCRMRKNLPLQRLERGQEVTQGTTSTSQKEVSERYKKGRRSSFRSNKFHSGKQKRSKKDKYKEKERKTTFHYHQILLIQVILIGCPKVVQGTSN